MKAISLPSNVMVYVVIALVVVTALVILMMEYYPKGDDYFFLLKKGCIEVGKNCDDKNWQDIIVEGKRTQPYTIKELCELNKIKIENCKKSCGCLDEGINTV